MHGDVGVIGRPGDAALGAKRQAEEHDHDHDGDRRVRDLDRDVLGEVPAPCARLVGSPAPVAHDRPHDEPVHDGRHDARGQEVHTPQVERVPGLFRLRLGHPERARARRKQPRAHGEGGSKQEARPAPCRAPHVASPWSSASSNPPLALRRNTVRGGREIGCTFRSRRSRHTKNVTVPASAGSRNTPQRR